MVVVQLTEWKPHLQKVSLLRLIQQHAGLPLAEAKACVDRHLNGEVVTLHIKDFVTAELFIREASEIGAVARIPQGSPPRQT